jgi:hypothetical protein
MEDHRSNSFAALQDTDGVDQLIDEEQTSKALKQDAVPRLRDPLIWIDLEMTGEAPP